MPCKCGKKVDRNEKHKILCGKCNQFMHIECYSINLEDLDIIKSKFSCQQCLSDRRASLDVDSIAVVANINNNKPVSKTAIKSNIAVRGGVVLKSTVQETNAKKANIADNNNATELNADGVSNINIELPDESAANVNLDMIYKEVIVLKQNNLCLSNMVSSLCDDNKILLNKIDALETLVRDLRISLDNKSNTNINFSGIERANSANVVVPIAKVNAIDDLNANLSSASSSNNIISYANAVGTKSNEIPYGSSVARDLPNLPLRHNNNNKHSVVMGTNDNNELGVFAKKKWIHLSSFKNNVSPDDIISYVTRHTRINKTHLECVMLVKKDAVVKNLKFVNFKLGVSSCFYDKIMSTSLWPANITVRPFRFLEKKVLLKELEKEQPAELIPA